MKNYLLYDIMTNFVTTPYIKDGEVGIEKFSVTYCQNADTNDNTENVQTMTLEVMDVPCDEEYPFYYNMSINGHWSFNDPQEIVDIIKDFEKRLKTK